MTTTQLVWLASIFVASITINLGLLRVITDDKLKRPNLAAILINILMSSVGIFFAIRIVGGNWWVAFILFNLLSFLTILYVVKKRDVKAVILGENLLVIFKRVDLQISYILGEINNRTTKDLVSPIRRTLKYILAELPVVLGMDSFQPVLISVLVPHGNRFKVVAHVGLENFVIDKMEWVFRYGSDAVSIAGQAMNQKRAIVINDLEKEEENEAIKYWIRVWDESKQGCLLAYPIMRGLGSSNDEPMAVLCISSHKKNAFDVKIVIQILNYFAPKIEILQNCMDLVINREEA